MRYKLDYMFITNALFTTAMMSRLTGTNAKYGTMLFGLTVQRVAEVGAFIGNAIYGYFHDSLVAYDEDDEYTTAQVFVDRLAYDVAIKMPYWYKKYQQIKKLLTTEDISLMQTSKVSSSSTDATHSAGGTLQKGATTPTGVTAETSPDEINITMGESQGERTNEVETNGFVDKYTNHQQKFVNASEIKGERSGEILREGSIDELLKVLEKLPSSFADEVTRDLQKHFIFDYEGEERGYYTDE